MNFLTLCQTLARESGGAATVPSAVTGQSGEALRFVKWIELAYNDIQTKWANWKFLWAEHTPTLSVDQYSVSAPSDLGEWKPGSFRVDDAPIQEVEWDQWDGKPTPDYSGKPHVAVVMPDNSIRLFGKADKAYTLRAEYYKTPDKMTANGDIPILPERFHSLIWRWALVFYGYYDAAPEVLQRAGRDLETSFWQLEASQLPGQHMLHNSSMNSFRVEVE